MNWGEDLLNLFILYTFPSHCSCMRIHLYWQLICRVELIPQVPLWDKAIPLLVCESTFCKTSMVLLYLMSQLASECYLNFSFPWVICFFLILRLLLASSWLWTSHLGKRLGNLTWWSLPYKPHFQCLLWYLVQSVIQLPLVHYSLLPH